MKVVVTLFENTYFFVIFVKLLPFDFYNAYSASNITLETPPLLKIQMFEGCCEKLHRKKRDTARPSIGLESMISLGPLNHILTASCKLDSVFGNCSFRIKLTNMMTTNTDIFLFLLFDLIIQTERR